MTAHHAAVRHIAACIAYVRPIDRAYLATILGVDGAVLESFINRAVCAFCMVSQGKTGSLFGRQGVRRGTSGLKLDITQEPNDEMYTPPGYASNSEEVIA